MKLTAIIIALSFLVILEGCSNQESIQQTLYSGNIDVHAPIAPPPMHLASAMEFGDLIVSPHFYINSNKSLDLSTENHYKTGVIPGDTNNFSVKDKNLSWSQPNALIGVDVDFALSKSISFFGGFQYTNTNYKDLLGGNFGIGLFSASDKAAFRIDAGFTYQQYSYSAATIIYEKIKRSDGSQTESISYIENQDIQMNLNPFVMFTLNSISTEQSLNYFISLGFFSQNLLGFDTAQPALFDYKPNYTVTDKRMDCDASFFILNPGLYFQFDKKTRFLFGVKVLKESRLASSQQWMVIPSFQADFNF